MAFNLMDLAKEAISKQVMEQLGSVLGEPQEKVSSAVEGAIPSILGGVLKKVMSPGGADEVFKQVQDNDGSILDNIGDILGGGNHQGVIDQGTGLLEGLLGGNLANVISLITKISGMKSGSVGGLLGLLGPILMGLLGKQQSAQGWDLAGFTSMLTDQKSNLANALPQGAIDAVGLGDLGLDKLMDSAGAASKAVGAVAGAAEDAASAVGSAASSVADESGSLIGKLLPLIVLGALAFLGYKFLGNANNGAEDAAPAATAGDVADETVDSETTTVPDATITDGETVTPVTEVPLEEASEAATVLEEGAVETP